MACGATLLALGLFASSVSAITNSQEAQHYSQLQYQQQQYVDQVNRGVAPPNEQQHRFIVNRARPQPQFTPFQQPYQQERFPFQNFQPPPYQVEKKPIALQPTFPQEQAPTYQPQQSFQQPFPQQNFQPSFSPPQATFQSPNYQSQQYQFENNYVLPSEKPRKHQQYLTEVSPPKSDQFQPVTYAPEPHKEETPSWVLETQPPTPYRKQKPYESITFATEAYRASTTPAPRIPKYRPRPTKNEEKFSNKDESGEIYIKPDRKKLYEQLVASAKPVAVTTPAPVSSTTKAPRQSDEQFIQEQLQKQIQEQLGGKDDIFKTLKITLPGDLSPDQIANLPNIALGDSVAQVPDLSSLSAAAAGDLPQSVYLANGQKLKVVTPGKSSKKNVKTVVIHQSPPSTTTTTSKPPTVLFEELTKGVLPPGADFELIRQKQDGALEEVGPNATFQQKKVTFVILEEQPDGSVKVQGVRGNENDQTETKGAEVDSIIERLKKGEIKLPPSTKLGKSPQHTPAESQASPNYVQHLDKSSGKSTTPKKKVTTTPTPVFVHSTQIANSHAGPILSLEDYKRSTTPSPSRKPQYSSPPRLSSVQFLPTIKPYHDNSISFTPSSAASSTVYPTTSDPTPSPIFTTHRTPTYAISPVTTTYPTSGSEAYTPTVNIPAVPNQVTILSDTLKSSGLFAMARYLRQSGLDMVLNETGPYTLFVPTDRAFRSLLVQLGGPDRAEIKFKENPRLLSGLLLHHVIPGAFKVDQLLDEMTGVSLAGTQLRVNTYTTHDNEWNDVKVVTINGAKVMREKSDIIVPQGVAHTVDRVMFPLPVGDVIQTLLADREGRFSKFVKLLQGTGVSSMLQGTKTYTVFAPTDTAFTEGELDRLLEQRGSARALALRHITPGTLYSAGMLFYQIRDSMNSATQIQLSKEAGRVKVNNAHVISRNIPATNGVIHAIDSLL